MAKKLLDVELPNHELQISEITQDIFDRMTFLKEEDTTKLMK